MTPPRPLSSRMAHVLALWFGCGRVPRMPGTAGTLGALPLYFILEPLGWGAVAVAAVVLTLIGVWAAGVVARELAVHDPQVVCIDEVAGVLVALAASPSGWKGTALAVVLFRLFDQTKPWPARAAERLPGGWGVVMDDVVAGLWAAGILLALRSGGWL